MEFVVPKEEFRNLFTVCASQITQYLKTLAFVAQNNLGESEGVSQSVVVLALDINN